MTYICDGVRTRGGACTVHEDDSHLKCHECARYIDAGDRFTIGPLTKDKPCCAACQPFAEQLSVFDGLAAPDVGRATPPAHLTMEDYQTQGGGFKHREQCAHCGGKGYIEEPMKLREKCPECHGNKWIWRDGRVTT